MSHSLTFTGTLHSLFSNMHEAGKFPGMDPETEQTLLPYMILKPLIKLIY